LEEELHCGERPPPPHRAKWERRDRRPCERRFVPPRRSVRV